MNKYITIILLAFSGSAFAETYLCIAEAGAGVSANESNTKFDAQVYDVSVFKFILSNSDGKWIVKDFGSEQIWLTCESAFICRTLPNSPTSFGGYFLRSNKNDFTASWSQGGESLIVAGRCSKI